MGRLRAATDTLKELAVVYLALLFAAAGAFCVLEGRTFLESLYWAGTTATSTGYGDISPKTLAGQVVALVLMHASIFMVVPLIVVRLIDRMNEDRDAFTHEEQVRILDSLARIEARLAERERDDPPRNGEGDRAR
ncbi:potassium channel family protein [Sphingomonas sp. IC-56]|uniref:potassium channel family protein n=1 Tax=Sphingomonas sp. IC-56 TaxID=2898529 RepID=UPI001E4FD8A7|nr:potassium channel family protein [Sphingomonas sp. IC-56]MCD2322980.1 potassium channel family protein [Sphingomonas sp. IC-56]